MIRRGIGVQSFVSAGGGTDADAQAFITAAGITDAIQKNAVNELTIKLKLKGIWTKMNAIYPFIGGNSTAHSYNLKNVTQYRITWGGGVTHSSNGVAGNGINGYGDTGFNFNETNKNNSHISTYIRTYDGNISVDFGSGENDATNESFILILGTMFINNLCGSYSTRIIADVGNATGLILNNRNSNNNLKTFRNSNILGTNSSDAIYTGGSNYNINLFRRKGASTSDLFSTRQTAFSSIGIGLTDSEVSDLYTIIQAYQTTLSRNV